MVRVEAFLSTLKEILHLPDVSWDPLERLTRRISSQTDAWRFLKLVQGSTMWPLSVADCDSVDLRGRNALITGGNIGIGFYTMRYLVSKGCNVFICCREAAPREPSAEDVIAALSQYKQHPEQTVEVWTLDCSSLASVKALADRFIRTKKPLHLLFNNAGICVPNLPESADGFEMHYAINFLSHFCLTLLLLPALKSADHARIINTSSCFHYFGPNIQWNKLNSAKAESWMTLPPDLMQYGRSKLCLAMFGKELNDRLAADPALQHIVVLSLHPGSIQTAIFTSRVSFGSVREAIRSCFVITAGNLSMMPEAGAKSLIKAALSDKDDRGLSGGRYWNRGWEVEPRPEVRDAAARRKLWEKALSEAQLPANLI